MSIFQKFSGNPVLTPEQFPDDIMYVFNPGAVKFNGEYLLMVDTATAATPIVFWLARSRDGVQFTIDPEPVEWPVPAAGPENCVYDPRITLIDGEYILMYASQAAGRGVRTGVVRTRDFRKFERIELEENGRNNRNSVLFPEKIGGRYVRRDRPMGDNELEPSDMCISYSRDLAHWEESQVLMTSRPGCWDSHKIGGGAVAVKDVPPNCTVIGIPGRIVKRDGKRVTSEQSAAAKRMENLPDIVEEQHRSNCARIDYLEAQIAALRDEVCPQFKKALADVEPVNSEDLEEG